MELLEEKTKRGVQKPIDQSLDRYAVKSNRDRVAHEREELAEDLTLVEAIAAPDQVNRGEPVLLPGRNECVRLRVHASAVQLDDTTIVKRVSIPWQYAFRAESGVSNREICSRASSYFGNLEIFIQKGTELITRFTKATSGKFFVRTFKSF